MFSGGEERGVVGELAGKVVNGVRLARPRRSVEKQTLLDWHAKLSELRTLFDEPGDVALEQLQGLGRENQFAAVDSAKLVNSDAASTAGVNIGLHQGDYLAAIRTGTLDKFFEVVKESAGKRSAFFAGGTAISTCIPVWRP